MNRRVYNISIELLKKYFQKKCNFEEKENITECLSDPGYEKQLKYLFREHWNEIALTPPGSNINSIQILDKIHHKIHVNAWEEIQNRPFYRKLYNSFSKIAAIIILPILIFGGWYFVKSGIFSNNDNNISYAEIFSPLGARTHFELPDGSTGWLNSGSTLKFPVRFRGTTRRVHLTGEGYFDVLKNPKKPFVVKTGSIEVMALGTKFNVLAYPDDIKIDITLESGKVVVNPIGKNKKLERITDLEPDQQVSIQKESMKFLKRKVDSKNYIAWKQGVLVFRNEPMTEVIKRLERWYNVEIILMDKEIANYSYRATFNDETINEVLTLIKLTSPIDFMQEKRVKLANGSFEKKKIEIFIRPEYRENFNN